LILGVFGLIAVGAALLLIYYSKKPSGTARAAGARRVQATVVPEKQYKTSDDGKVVYLFDEDADEAADRAADIPETDTSGGSEGDSDRQAAPDDVPPVDGPDGGGGE
jgi:hypothetical protein